MSSLSAASGTLAGLNTSGISFSGLASGLDTSKIIQGLVAVQQAQITNLQNNQAQVVAEQGAFKTLDAKLLAFQAQTDQLSKTFNTVFDARTVTSSNQALATGAASSSAAPGNYTFTVNALAQAQQITSQGFASAQSTITQGTLQLRVGTGATTTITINNSNNTLQRLADAINTTGGDVSAAVVNTGSGAQPYQLLLSSRKTGLVNTITVTNNLAASGGGAVQPSLTSVVQAAANASITLGSGAGAVTIASPSNTVDGIFNGLTVNLVAADSTHPVTLAVATDTATPSKAVHDFVAAFNDLIDFINSKSTYDAQTNTAGVLLGDQSASDIQNNVTDTLGGVVGGVNGLANRLSAIGITLNDQGKLDMDDTKLTRALSGQLTGVNVADVRRLFALDGQSTNSGVQFVSAGDHTNSSTSPVQVVITRAATQASITATSALAASTVITNTNNTLNLTVDGKASGPLSLAAGTYTQQALAQEVQSEINASSKLGGAGVTVSVINNRLQITSQSYGSTSQVTVGTGTALAALGLAGTETGRGQDVAGHFVVNGVAEAATSSGQFLSGSPANAHTAGLVVRVTLTSAQVTGDPVANVTLSRGIASQLRLALKAFLDPVSGRLHTLDQSFQDRVDSIQKTIVEQTAKLQAQQQSLAQQFTAMEATISQLKTTGSFLNGQLLGINNLAQQQTSTSFGPSANTTIA